ncbi:U6 small ribonucleoprotein F, partial [Haematococcus lacustris]
DTAPAASDLSTGSSKSPAEFLKAIKGKQVQVKLNSGVDYRGVLACLDGYMNIAMEQTEEYVNGQLKNKYGDAFIRGNNGEPVVWDLEGNRAASCSVQ